MKIILDLLKVLLFSLLFLFMFAIKSIRSFLVWAVSCMDKIMTVGDNGLDSEMERLKASIKEIIIESYSRIKS